MAYSKKAQARYDKKCSMYSVKYTPTDINDGKRLQMYLSQTGQSANAYIKSLIKADLDSKGIAYPTIDSTQADSDSTPSEQASRPAKD